MNLSPIYNQSRCKKTVKSIREKYKHKNNNIKITPDLISSIKPRKHRMTYFDPR